MTRERDTRKKGEDTPVRRAGRGGRPATRFENLRGMNAFHHHPLVLLTFYAESSHRSSSFLTSSSSSYPSQLHVRHIGGQIADEDLARLGIIRALRERRFQFPSPDARLVRRDRTPLLVVLVCLGGATGACCGEGQTLVVVVGTGGTDYTPRYVVGTDTCCRRRDRRDRHSLCRREGQEGQALVVLV